MKLSIQKEVAVWNDSKQTFVASKKTAARIFIIASIIMLAMMANVVYFIVSNDIKNQQSQLSQTALPANDSTESAIYHNSQDIVAVKYLGTEESTAITIQYYSNGDSLEVGINTNLYPNWQYADMIEGITTRGTDTWNEAAKAQTITIQADNNKPSDYEYHIIVESEGYSLYNLQNRLVGYIPYNQPNLLDSIVVRDNQ